MARANLGFELSDPDLFANAFAADAVYELASDIPVFGYAKLRYGGRDDVRTIISDRLERARISRCHSLPQSLLSGDLGLRVT